MPQLTESLNNNALALMERVDRGEITIAEATRLHGEVLTPKLMEEADAPARD